MKKIVPRAADARDPVARDRAIERVVWWMIELVEEWAHGLEQSYPIDDLLRVLAAPDRKEAEHARKRTFETIADEALTVAVRLTAIRRGLKLAHAEQEHAKILVELGRVSLLSRLPRQMFDSVEPLKSLALALYDLRNGHVATLLAPAKIGGRKSTATWSLKQQRLRRDVAVCAALLARTGMTQTEAERAVAKRFSPHAVRLGLKALSARTVRDWRSEILKPGASSKGSEALPLLVTINATPPDHVHLVVAQYEASCARL